MRVFNYGFLALALSSSLANAMFNDMTCGDDTANVVQFTAEHQEAVFNTVVRYHKLGITRVTKYPKLFLNREGLALDPRCAGCAASGRLREYPILAGGSAYQTGNPGPFRLVVCVRPGSSPLFCGLIYHPDPPEVSDVYDLCVPTPVPATPEPEARPTDETNGASENNENLEFHLGGDSKAAVAGTSWRSPRQSEDLGSALGRSLQDLGRYIQRGAGHVGRRKGWRLGPLGMR